MMCCTFQKTDFYLSDDAKFPCQLGIFIASIVNLLILYRGVKQRFSSNKLLRLLNTCTLFIADNAKYKNLTLILSGQLGDHWTKPSNGVFLRDRSTRGKIQIHATKTSLNNIYTVSIMLSIHPSSLSLFTSLIFSACMYSI